MGRLIAGLLMAGLVGLAPAVQAQAAKTFKTRLSPVPVTAYNVNVVGSGTVTATLTRLGRNDEALQWFERAGRERPQSAEPHIYLALMHARANRNGDAVREATAALQIDEASANLQFTQALQMPPDPSNLRGWIAWLQTKTPAGANPGGRR